MYAIILNMDSKIKSRIVHIKEFSPFVNRENGFRQVEQLSAFLFYIYLNDLHDFLNSSNVQGLLTICLNRS